MEPLPAYVSTVFILTTFAAVGFLIHAIKSVGTDRLPSQILIFVLPLWIFFQAALSLGGFYKETNSLPPRLLLFGVGPALLLVIAFFLFFRSSFIEKLPLRTITLLHIVRIPVEIGLFWLFNAGQIPKVMTFEGRNFDILSGFLAAIVFFAAFRGNKPNRWMLIAFNLVGLALLINIVGTAVAALPSPMQAIAFDQPNRAVLYFPYIWLPTMIVPIVLFAHLAALWKLFTGRDK